jgi:hypothetical protein
MKIFFKKLHRWLGFLMAIQIIAWMASGLYFSLVPISEIRGEHLTRPGPVPDRQQLTGLVRPDRIPGLLDQHFGSEWTLNRLDLVSMNGNALWRVEAESVGNRHIRLIAANGRQVAPRLSAEQAGSLAKSMLIEPAESDAVEWIETLSQSPEIRGRELPVWKVVFSQPHPVNLYIEPWTGELLARRTRGWRIFDFL